MSYSFPIYNWTAYADGLFYSNDQDASEDATYTPFTEVSFEGGTSNTSVSPEISSAYGTVYTNAEAAKGSQSAKVKAKAGWATGSDGTNSVNNAWGMIHALPTDLVQGDSVWIRQRMKFETGFNFASDFNLKTIRVLAKTLGGSAVGHIDLYITPAGKFYHQNELGGNASEEIPSSPTLTTGIWQDYEVQVLFHNTAGEYRVWFGETLIYELTGIRTLGATDGKCNTINDFTYFNGGCPVQLSSVTGTFQVPVNTSGTPDLTFDAATKTCVRATGSWVSDGFVVGMSAHIASTVSNSSAIVGAYKINTVTATTLTFDETPVDEVVSGAKVIGKEKVVGGTSGAEMLVTGVSGTTVISLSNLNDVGRTGDFTVGETVTGDLGATGVVDWVEQYAYIDDIIMTSETPNTVDASNNPRIGTAKVAV